MPAKVDAESRRLAEDAVRAGNWKRWGPYLSERQWATVREDYSADGNCWAYFPHDHARSRAYRWGEDGLLGWTDRQCRISFALALWNGKDPILKERLFGVVPGEGNHGEDVKECYYYLESTPTHSYNKALYKYPQREFPYQQLIDENRRRGKSEPEYELNDTGIFDDSCYFDCLVEYAKADQDDTLIKITVYNRGPETATIHLLPTIWFRNTWSWGEIEEAKAGKPSLCAVDDNCIKVDHPTLGKFRFEVEGSPHLLFTENDTNTQRIWGYDGGQPFTKDAFHRYVIHREYGAINSGRVGTKAAAYYQLDIPAGGKIVVKCRLRPDRARTKPFGKFFDEPFNQAIKETNEFYDKQLAGVAPEDRAIARQAYAGMLWSKQFYNYVVAEWLDGDPGMPKPPEQRKDGRNHDWRHLYNRDVISMPDNWEYPWYASWDMAFHMLCFAKIDPEFAKDQLLLLLREWYMHPSGRIPAYEFAFDDVNPPVHAWACWRVYKMTGPRGQRDILFLERAFQKLLLNFTWWVNRKDITGRNVFGGGFLGLDNIGVFDRSKPMPNGMFLEQADGTAWMAFYCLTMLCMALELALERPAYEDIASKFFEHFVAITHAINTVGGTGLWDETDGFYYDHLHIDGTTELMKVRSMVGLLPLIAVQTLEEWHLDKLPNFKKRMNWFLTHRPELGAHIARSHIGEGKKGRYLLAITNLQQLSRVLGYMLDENEFLSKHGLRSLSKYHESHPYSFQGHEVKYDPGESTTEMFGGNSNWRGPIWFPVNFLLMEALERFHHFYGDGLVVECPSKSGNVRDLQHIADFLQGRLIGLFRRDEDGSRACHGHDQRYAADPNWRDLILFHEYFHGETGQGLGASHQTGWTGLVANLVLDTVKDAQRNAKAEKKPIKKSHKLRSQTPKPAAQVTAPPNSSKSAPRNKKPTHARASRA